MFGWQSRPDRDAVAAAQRRLAAMAASFPTLPSGELTDLEDPGDDVSDQGSGRLGVDFPGAGSRPRSAAGLSASRSGFPGDPVGGDRSGDSFDVDRSGDPVSADGSGDPVSADRLGAPPRHLARAPSRLRRRLAMSPHHVAVMALAVVIMVALAAWWVLRSVPQAQPVQLSSQRTLPSAPAPTTAPSSPAGSTAAASPAGSSPASTAPPVAAGSATGSVVVDVAGRVRRPGIVQLPAGARVVDALRAAGGARPGVQTRSLNLARPLVDGEQIVVGLRTPAVAVDPGSAGTATAGSTIAPVNLNTATAEQLDTLPGIGPVTAQAILTWRTENGSFTSVDELLEVSGIGDATLADIAPYVYV